MIVLRKIKWINPEWIFSTEPPVINKDLKRFDYWDKSEIDLRSYLQVLPSIALYGFQYVVVLDRANRVRDGNFRVYAAKELGLKVPCVCFDNSEGLPPIIHRVLWKFRRVIGIMSLFQRKIVNKSFRKKKVMLVCKFQRSDSI